MRSLDALLDAWHAWAARCLADERFQRWASRFWLTAPLARRHARDTFDLVAGFVYSQVLLACVELGVFDALVKQGVLHAHDLALSQHLPLERAECLLRAAVAVRLLVPRRTGGYGLGPRGAPIAANAGILAMVRHHRALYADLTDPVALLRAPQPATELAKYWAYASSATPGDLPLSQTAPYSTLMDVSQSLVARQVIDSYRFARHRCVLDVGGGLGGFVQALAQTSADLRLMLFDLPSVVDLARERLRANGLGDRVKTFGGDFAHDDLPRGADLVTLVRVVHDHDDDTVVHLLQRVRRVLPSKGTVLIAEPLAGVEGAQAVGDAYFGFYLLAMGRGRARTAAHMAALLERAGFERPRLLRTHMNWQVSVMTAQSPSILRDDV
ncbi:MAG: methyltransferase domain-containing protein [Betaproteobacteria bacterium]|nr:methyltransferase domain-containing protein [Betaproteobacteria bacterium]